jgi:hypothetical protein
MRAMDFAGYRFRQEIVREKAAGNFANSPALFTSIADERQLERAFKLLGMCRETTQPRCYCCILYYRHTNQFNQ